MGSDSYPQSTVGRRRVLRDVAVAAAAVGLAGCFHDREEGGGGDTGGGEPYDLDGRGERSFES